MSKIPLSLDPDPDPDEDADAAGGAGAAGAPGDTQPAPAAKAPVMGWCAVGFGLLGIFSVGYVFVPLALICSVVALVLGQVSWAFVGLLLSVAGLLTSPVLLGILGMAWLASYLGIPM